MIRRLACVATVAVALLTGCATVPTTSQVKVVPTLSNEDALRVPEVGDIAPSPVSGDSLATTVQKFLSAGVDETDGYAAARAFLSPSAATQWKPESVRVYSPGSLQLTPLGGTTNAVGMSVEVIGQIAADGSWSYDADQLRAELSFVKVDGIWRITNPPPVRLLSETDARRAFQAVDLMYLPAADTSSILVPDRVYLQASSSRLLDAIMSRFTAGPTSWLGGAVRSTLSGLTSDPVTIRSDGTAVVALHSASGQGRPVGDDADLLAQIGWTLTLPANRTGVVDVAVSVDGRALGGFDINRDLGRYDPTSYQGSGPYYQQGKRNIMRVDLQTPVSLFYAGLPTELQSLTITPDGSRIAGLAPGTDRPLALGEVSGERVTIRRVAVPGTPAPPTIGPGGDPWVAVTNNGASQIYAVGWDGVLAEVDTAAIANLGRLWAIRVSPDGTRLALIAGASHSVFVASILRSGDGWQLASPRAMTGVGPEPADKQADVAWSGANQLTVLTEPAGGGAPAPATIDVGSLVGPSSVRGTQIKGTMVSITAAPGMALVVGADNPSGIYSLSSEGGYLNLASAVAGAAAQTDPFYSR